MVRLDAPKRLGLATVFLSIALGATLLSWGVATGNFQVVDPSHDARLNEIFAPLEGDETRRLAVRYVASESNRSMFELLGPGQLGCVLVAFALAFAPARELAGRRRSWSLVLLGLALAAALLSGLLVSPIVELGREIDFVSRHNGDPPEVQQFARLHVAYVLADLVKVIASILLVPLLLPHSLGDRGSH